MVITNYYSTTWQSDQILIETDACKKKDQKQL
jgi:hypothetical protein